MSFIQIFRCDFRGIPGAADTVADGESLDLQDKDFVAVYITADQFSVESGDAFLIAKERVQLLCIHHGNRNGKLRKNILHFIDGLCNALYRYVTVVCNQDVSAGGIKVIIHDPHPRRDAGQFIQRIWIGIFTAGKYPHLQTGRYSPGQSGSRSISGIGVITYCAESAFCIYI